MEDNSEAVQTGSAANRHRLQGFLAGLLIAAVVGVAVYASLPGSKDPAVQGQSLTGTAVAPASTATLYRRFPKEVRQGPFNYDGNIEIPYLAEVRLTAFSYEAQDHYICRGQTFAVRQYQALFSLLGNSYGGDGRTTFMLPNISFGNPDPQTYPASYFGNLKYQICAGPQVYPSWETEGFTASTDANFKYWACQDLPAPTALSGRFLIGEIVLLKDLDEARYKDIFIPCDGRVLEPRNNANLYSLLGDSFGAGGQPGLQFKVPDLSKAPVPADGAKYYVVATGGGWPDRK